MLRTIFIGTKNDFSQMLVHWLAQRTDVAGVVWSSSATWHRTWEGGLEFATKRLKRHGALKTLDEALFYIIYHTFFEHRNRVQLEKNLLRPYKNLHDIRWHGDKIRAADVNSPAVLDFIRERKPDIILAQCINEYFGRELREMSQHGLFLLHDGITPEYKGLYSPFWAVHNLDFARIGGTLLLVNAEYDSGDIFVQESVSDLDHCVDHCYMGHKAIAGILPKVESFLIHLECGTACPIDSADRASRSYTYPGCTDLLRQRIRLWRWNAQQAALKKRKLRDPGGTKALP
jgi:hypothetical protein